MMNYNRTLQCSKAKEGYRKEAKYPPNRLRRLQTFASLKFARRDAVQPCKKSHMIGDHNVSLWLEELSNSKHGKDVVDSLICHKDQFRSVFTTFAASFCLTEDLHWPKWIANSVAVSVDVFCSGWYENYEGASAR